MTNDFISTYLAYTSKTECPTFFHRWCAYTALSAWIGRDIHFPFGHFRVHANMYVMLVGLAGTKKSTAIKISAELLERAGYKNFAADKTRQEKFLIDLADRMKEGEELGDDILDMNLFGDTDVRLLPPAEVFVAADEINNFISVGNMEFMSILGELWDIDKPYRYKLKNSASVVIPYPTITILGGNTFVGFNKLFPPEAIEQGFFSRLLFIYGEPTGVRYTIPEEPDTVLKESLILQLKEIKKKVRGKIVISEEAFELLDTIYHTNEGMEDTRFDAYNNRRQIHLLKLCMLVAASRLSTTIQKADLIEANTLLTLTEYLMPKALGEFGKARNSAVSHKIMSIINNAKMPVTFLSIWQVVIVDLESRGQLVDILANLQVAEKIQAVGGEGYLPIKKVRTNGVAGAVDWSLLTQEEKDLGGIE